MSRPYQQNSPRQDRPQADRSFLVRASLGAFLGAFLVLPVVPLVSCSSTDDGQPEELTDDQLLGIYLENALRYLDLREYDRAQDQAMRGLEVDPGNSRFLMIYGRCRLQRGTAADIQAAIETFEQVSEQDDWRVNVSLGEALERKGVFYEEAADGVRDGSRPTDAPNRAERADELLEEAHGFWRKSILHYKVSLENRSGEPQTINGLVRASAYLGEFDQSIEYARELIAAIRSAQRLVDIQLEDAEISADRESRLFRDRRSNRAFEVRARLHIATLLYDDKKLSKAADEFDEIILIEPELAEAYSRKAQILFELGEYVKARSAITRFIELKAKTAEFEDPSIRRAYDLQDRCNRAIGT